MEKSRNHVCLEKDKEFLYVLQSIIESLSRGLLLEFLNYKFEGIYSSL